MPTKSTPAMRLSLSRFTLCLVACVLFLRPRLAHASPPAPIYDLDSLVWMSGATVEARVVPSTRKGYENVLYFRVQDSFNGEAVKGQDLFIENIDYFHKPRVAAEKSATKFVPRGFVVGDQVILFLEKPRLWPGDNKVFDSLTWSCIDSGLRWLNGNRFHKVSQRSLGALDTVRPETAADGHILSADEFRESVRQSVLKINAWKQQINAPLDAAQARWLRDFLIGRERGQSRPTLMAFDSGRDVIGAAASYRLAQWDQPEFLLETLTQSVNQWSRSSISRGLATPQGREFLLQHLTDRNQPLKDRLVLAESVSSIPFDYSQSPDFAVEATRPDRFGGISVAWRSAPNPSPDNGHWIKRLAQIAMAEREAPALSLSILSGFPHAAHGFTYAPAEVQGDWRDALQVLGEQHAAVKAPELRFAIEKIVSVIDQPRLQILNPQIGPILSICSAPEQERASTAQRKLEFAYEVQTVSDEARGARCAVILRDVAGGRLYQLPIDLPVSSAGSGSSGQELLPVPDDFPRGRFHVFLQFSRGQDIISRGYGFDTDL